MNIERLGLKYLVIVGIIALGLSALWPPEQKLKPGIDLAGGTSLTYEIDTTGLEDDQISNIADRVITQLRQRVDPTNQRNLVWRKVGRTRIEIQMPGTTGEMKLRRTDAYAALEALVSTNLKRGEIEAMLRTPSEARPAAIERLLQPLASRAAGLTGDAATKVNGLSTTRRGLLEDLAVKYDAYRESQAPATMQAFDAAHNGVTATNLEKSRLKDVLNMDKDRQPHLDKIIAEHPGYAFGITEVVDKWDAFASNRGMLDDPEDLKRLLRGAGVLEFRIVAQRESVDSSRLESRAPELRQSVSDYEQQLEQRGPRYRQGKPYQWFHVPDPVGLLNASDADQIPLRIASSRYVMKQYADEWYVLAYDDPRFSMLKKQNIEGSETRWKLKQAWAGRNFDSGAQIVNFTLDARGGEQFGRLTSENTERPLGIFLDNASMTVANIRSRITDRGFIEGEFSPQEISFLVNTLEAGSLPARLKEPPLSERSVGSTLGQSNLERGFRSVVYGLIAVAAFMLIYYLGAGIIANIALMLNLILVLAFMATLEATFTLPGIAGLILTVGMAVDANVLIFERIREETKRGSSIKMALKNGYEKAFSTILDANVTTLITCIILGYAGSEEVKGFAIVLGLGVVFSMFTALWVTRVIFAGLVQSGIMKSIPMLRFIGVPTVAWMELRRILWPVSLVVVTAGAGLFAYEHATHPSNLYDIEFLGGTAVTVELRDGVEMGDAELRDRVAGTGKDTAAGWLQYASEALPDAKVTTGSTRGIFRINHAEFTPDQLEVMVMTKMSDDLEGAGQGVMHIDSHTVEIATREEQAYDLARVNERLGECSAYLAKSANRLRSARVQIDTENIRAFDINTTEPQKEVIRQAIVQVMQNELKVQLPVTYALRKDTSRAPDGFFPVTASEDHAGPLRLEHVIGGQSTIEVDAFRGGVAIVFDQLSPSQTPAELHDRLRTASLLPEFEQYEFSAFEVVGLQGDPRDAALAADDQRVTSFALLVSDDNIVYDDNAALWESDLAKPELAKAAAALGSKKTLQKVEKFAPQIAADHTVKAIMAIILALVMIVGYIAIRFGEMRFGLAAIVALVHDVSISLGAVAASYYIVNALGVGNFLGIGDFKIDLAMIGALLTIVGYSLNDTIVLFDRIRENRGKTRDINESIVNLSVNQTLSRTLLTSVTTLVAVTVMYAIGGQGIHGFSFALIIGVIAGTYSSVAIATPLVLNPRLLKLIINVLVVATLIGLVRTLAQPELQVMVWIFIGGYAIFLLTTMAKGGKSKQARRFAQA
jgi:SecD/SecF fusion protein